VNIVIHETLWFSSTNFKIILKPKNYWVNFVAKFTPKKCLLVNMINGINNSDMFSCSYDDL